MGLVNRIVPHGGARARRRNPSRPNWLRRQACLRNDRMSAIESIRLDHDAAMAGEFARDGQPGDPP